MHLAATRLALGQRKPTARSKVSNGREVLPGVDGRSIIARRYHDIMSAIVVDQGGADAISETRLQLIRRFAAAAVLSEEMESKLANGGEIDIGEHCQLVSVQTKIAARLGVDRVPRDVGPSLSDLMRQEQP